MATTSAAPASCERADLPRFAIRDSRSVAQPGRIGARFHPNVPANFDQPWSWTVRYVSRTTIAGNCVAFFQESLSERESRGQVENGDNKTQLCEDPCCGIRSEFSH